MARTSGWSIRYDDLRIIPLLFADDVVLLGLGWFATKLEPEGMRVSTSKSEAMLPKWKTMDCSFCELLL